MTGEQAGRLQPKSAKALTKLWEEEEWRKERRAMHAVAAIYTAFNDKKKSYTADDLLGKSPGQQGSARPNTEQELQDKIARVLGGLN